MLNGLRVPYFIGDVHDRRLEIDFALGAVELDVNAALRLDALELRQEIDVEICAPEFAIGDAAEPKIFLEFDDAANRFIFHAAKLLRSDRAVAKFFSRVQKKLRTQKAADMIVGRPPPPAARV